MVYGDEVYCLYDENMTNEFKAFAFMDTRIILNAEEIMLNAEKNKKIKGKCKKTNTQLLEDAIKEKINIFLNANSSIFEDCLVHMFDKYFCNYVSCFYNSKLNNECNLYFGVNDSGIEIGIPIKKRTDVNMFVANIVKECLRKYKMLNILTLRKSNGKIENINDVLNNISVTYYPVEKKYIENVHNKNNSIIKSVKKKITDYKSNKQDLGSILNIIDNKFSVLRRKNSLVATTIYKQFNKFSYWIYILKQLDVEELNNTEIFNMLYPYDDEFVRMVDTIGLLSTPLTNIYKSSSSKDISAGNVSDNSGIDFIKKVLTDTKLNLEKNHRLSKQELQQAKDSVQNYISAYNIKANIANLSNSDKKLIDETLVKNYTSALKYESALTNRISKLEHMRRMLDNNDTINKIHRIIKKQIRANNIMKNSNPIDNKYMSMYNSNIINEVHILDENEITFLGTCKHKITKMFIKKNSMTFVVDNFENLAKYLDDYDLYIIKISIFSPNEENDFELIFKESIDTGYISSERKIKDGEVSCINSKLSS